MSGRRCRRSISSTVAFLSFPLRHYVGLPPANSFCPSPPFIPPHFKPPSSPPNLAGAELLAAPTHRAGTRYAAGVAAFRPPEGRRPAHPLLSPPLGY
uniref:Uncharacterized protein n=1 Tax=Oryza meridionalis TaxID=40149 RepID=A0A0E0DCL3_9ORYZ